MLMKMYTPKINHKYLDCICSVSYAYFIPYTDIYAYGMYHTRMVQFCIPYAYGMTIRVWYVPYARGPTPCGIAYEIYELDL